MKLKNLAWFPKPNEVPYCFFDGEHFRQQNWPWTIDQIYSFTWKSNRSLIINALFATSPLYESLINNIWRPL